MVAPIEVKVEEGKGGKVEISEGEYTSEGFALQGLNPLEPHSAGIACWYTGPQPAIHQWPNNKFFGSFVAATRFSDIPSEENTYAPDFNSNPVINNTDSSIVGYKYFNFDVTRGRDDVELLLMLTPEGIDGTIEVMAGRPWTSQGGQLLGTIELKADMPQTPTEMRVTLPDLGKLEGKQAIFFKFFSDTKEKSLCMLDSFVFK